MKVEELSQKLAAEGADMLADCIRDSLYLFDPTLSQTKTSDGISDISQLTKSRPAPKITKADQFIDWTTNNVEEITRKHRVIGPLWSLIKEADSSRNDKRVIWSSGFSPTSVHPDIDLAIGQPVVMKSQSLSRDIYVRTCDDQILKIRSIKVEGGDENEPFRAALRARIHEPNSVSANGPLFRGQVLSVLPDQYKSQI